MNILLKDLSDIDCYNFFLEINRNSDNHWASAEILSKSEDHGGGINKLIISIEEKIKAVVMLADAKGFEFRKIEGVDALLLRSHSLRQVFGFIMFILYIVVEDFKKHIEMYLRNPDEYKSKMKNKEWVENSIQSYIIRKIEIIKNEFQWFSKLETIRQQSTYVDFGDKIISPLALTSVDYNETFLKMNCIRSLCNEAIKMLSSKGVLNEKEIELIKAQFASQKWYEKIGKAIKSTKKGKKDPFGLLGNEFKDLDLDI